MTQNSNFDRMAGLTANNEIDECDVCGDNLGTRELDVQNEETGEMATAWVCSECEERTERYNSGDESAFDDIVPEKTEQEGE